VRRPAASPGQPATPDPGSRRPAILLSIILIFLAGIFVGRYVVPGSQQRAGSPVQIITADDGERQFVFPTFWEAWDNIHEKYIDIGEVDQQALFYGAVRGLVGAVGDPYTVFADPPTTTQFEENIGGSFSGVGIEIGVRNGVVTVIAPLEGSPAKAAGILEGDIIVAVDEEPITQEMSLDDVVTRIRGEQGTTVNLTVVHQDSRETEQIDVTRDTIEIESVKLTIEDDIAHVAITNFNGDTASRFTSAAREIERAGVDGIILDVRGNPGGFLQSAVDIASRFLPRGDIVVTERGKETTEYEAKGNTILADIPVVVLVNGGSASASEILAGALHDQLGTPIIGQQTFGKGSVQELVKLGDGSSLRVTIARWFTPAGKNIDHEGIAPTIEIEQDTDTEEDEQLVHAREELQSLINSR